MMLRLIALLALLFGFAAPAAAHPHVWVTMKSEIVYAPDGSMTGVRHAWTFDEMFSTFATQGLETKTKGVFTRDDLAPLAEVNISSLKEYDYFTHATTDGKKASFAEPKDYWLEFGDSMLTLHFFLPLQQPAKVHAFQLDVYDGAYFVDFSFAKGDAVSLAGAPSGCKLTTSKPPEQNLADGKRLSESFFNDPAASDKLGAQFANKISVTCP